MNNVQAMFERVLGIRSHRPAAHSSNLAASSREKVTMEALGPGLKIVLAEDLNPATGHLFPDYLQRREARKRAEARPEVGAVVIEGNFNPR